MLDVVRSCIFSPAEGARAGVSTALDDADGRWESDWAGVLEEEGMPRISAMAVADLDARPFMAMCRARCARILSRIVVDGEDHVLGA